MADVKISELPSAASLGTDEVFPIVQEGVTKKATVELIRQSVIENILNETDSRYIPLLNNVPVSSASEDTNVLTGQNMGFGLYWDNSSDTVYYTGTPTASESYSSYNIIKNGRFDTKNEPKGAVDSNGDIWIGSVGSYGEIYLSKRSQEGYILRKKIGNIRGSLSGYVNSDLHNGPVVLTDNRPGATYPIIIFQSDHSVIDQGPRMIRSNNLDLNNFSTNWELIPNALDCTYVQVYRFNDEIFLFTRIGSDDVDPTRPWRLCYSSDNGDNWVTRDLFDVGHGWLYLSSYEKSDGSGINISFWEHNNNGQIQDITFAYLDYTSGSLISPGIATPLISDIRAAANDPSFVPINPMTEAQTIYSALTNETTRAIVVGNQSSGNCIVSFISNVSGTNRVVAVDFSLSDGTINNTHELYSSAEFGIQGTAILNTNTIVWFTWLKEYDVDNDRDYGTATMNVSDISNPADIKSYEIVYSEKRLTEPFIVPGTNVMVFVENLYQNTQGDFYGDVYVHDFDEENYTNPAPYVAP